MPSVQNSSFAVMSLEVKNDVVMLPLMEYFYTIQGEGFYQGRAAYFIRLGGCDVGCTWCDVKESWDVHAHPMVDINRMAQLVQQDNAEMVVITGGEPLMHNLDALTELLQSKGIETNIETSGAYPLSGKWDWICVSPKRFKKALPEVLQAADELKVVIFHENDLRWAEQHLESVKDSCKLYLQPEWSVQSTIVPLIIEFVKRNPKWEISLQIHKYLNVP